MSKMKKASTLCALVLLSSQTLIPSVTSAATLSGDNTVNKSSTQTNESPSVVDASSDIASGTWGTVPWTIDSEGTLSLEGGTGADATTTVSPWDSYKNKIKKIVLKGKVTAPQNSSYLFENLYNVTEIQNLNNLDTSKVTDMDDMFSGMSGLTSLDLSSFDTSKVTNMTGMFSGCIDLTSLDLSHFDTSKVTTMSYMFARCIGLTSLDLSSFDTSKVTYMDSMFSGCSGLTSLDLSHFDTSKVINMSYMFYGMSGLTSLDLSSFDTSKVTTMSYMFAGCSGLTSLDLSHFDTSKVTNMNYMFSGMSGLTSLDLSSFDTSKVTNMLNMFTGSDKLYTLRLGGKTALLFNNTALYDANWVNQSNTWTGDTSALLTRSKTGTGDTYFSDIAPEGKPVNVKYVDEAGNEIHASQNLTGKVGMAYDASSDKYKLSIAGYTLDTSKLPTNATGTFIDQAQTVTYVYKANPEGQAVNVNYMDESGKQIHAPQSLTGKVGVVYDASSDKYKLSIAGYTLDTSKLPTNATGTFTDQAQTVTYVYKANPVPDKSQTIYRLYNPNTGEHFYTASSYEYDSVAKAGWRKEGIGWTAPEKGQAVYRLYNPNTGEHFYTLSAYEYNSVAKAGWRKEGIAFYSDNEKGTPIYRAFNPNSTGPGSHLFTGSSYEYKNVAKAGWRKEGVAFYGMK